MSRSETLTLRILTYKFGEIPDSLRARINVIDLNQLNRLGEALLGFQTLSDLETWLAWHLN